jgi:hypothetical protein
LANEFDRLDDRGDRQLRFALRRTGALRTPGLFSHQLQRFVAHAAERTLGIDLSTQRVAASARHYLDAILRTLIIPQLSLLQTLREVFAFMRDNARRAHPLRDRRTGRLSSGLRLVGVQ